MWKIDHQEWDYVVLTDERDDNEGMSVTNNAAGIANAVLVLLLPSLTDPTRVAFYERYPLTTPERADRVLLSVAHIAGSSAGYERDPEWQYGTTTALVELLGVTLAEES